MDSLYVQRSAALHAVRFAHTVIWAFFAGCILTIPVFAWNRRFEIVLALHAAVLVEIAVLILNRWSCPLTTVASRYTEDREDNFDIYLPVWLARYNKMIFGWLYGAGLLFSVARWQRWL